MPSEHQPIFVLSTPRAGSTLLQRVLGSHGQIHTVSEPHLLLPLVYSLEPDKSYTEYGHGVCARAIRGFCRELPEKERDYQAAIRSFALELYRKATPDGVPYFLDKTPRYSLIADALLETFPDGKFILLYRNPLAVLASIMETFKKGKWCLYAYNADLFVGLPKLVAVGALQAGRCHSVRYEDLVSGDQGSWRALFDYLELPYDEESLSAFTRVELKGMGDPTGSRSYRTLSQEPLDKWKRTLGNPLRRAWCRSYLKWLGRERLSAMGYDLDELLAELASLPVGFRDLFSDLFRIPYGWLYRVLEPKFLVAKLRSLPRWHEVHPHI